MIQQGDGNIAQNVLSVFDHHISITQLLHIDWLHIHDVTLLFHQNRALLRPPHHNKRPLVKDSLV